MNKKTKRFIANVVQSAELHNWNVTTQTQGEKTEFTFQCYTHFGQDFYFDTIFKHNNLFSLAENVLSYYENYDTDTETYIWLDTDGHGRNGAPYHIKGILADMEEIEEKLYELYCTIKTITNEFD